MDYKEIGCEGVRWINLAGDRTQLPAVVNVVIKLWVIYWPGT
jgi:NADPH-dependent ferric siderophore reductase